MSVLKRIFIDFLAWLKAGCSNPYVSTVSTPPPTTVWKDCGKTNLEPTYFVMHPDNTYSAAKPQPRVRVQPYSFDNSTIAVLQFLLSQAPMIDAPRDKWNAARATTRFAYIHPKTLAAIASGECTIRHGKPYVVLSPSQTRWVSTSLIPEGRVIYSPNPVPGLEKLLAS